MHGSCQLRPGPETRESEHPPGSRPAMGARPVMDPATQWCAPCRRFLLGRSERSDEMELHEIMM